MKQKIHRLRNSVPFRSSLRFHIGLIYLTLSIVNLVFFSVMIFENQMDLLVENFRLQAESLARTLSSEIQSQGQSLIDSSDANALTALLISRGVSDFLILDSKGTVLSDNPDRKFEIPNDLETRIQQLKNKTSPWTRNYDLKLDTEKFLLELLIPIRLQDDNLRVLFISEPLVSVKDKMRQLYLQLAIGIGWIFLFHLLFGIYLFRRILIRLETLNAASGKMAAGELGVRAKWKRKYKDEIDSVGDQFNQMADQVEAIVHQLEQVNEEVLIELKVGKQVQDLMLPDLRMVSDWKPAIFYRPLREVSGDIYNFYTLRDGRKVLFLADATGHGTSAALVTSLLLMKLEETLKTEENPGQVLRQMNATLFEMLQGSFFASAILAILENSGRITIANAGHNPPLFFQKGTIEAQRIIAQNTVLGLLAENEVKSIEYELQPGDKLFFYTDGLTESTAKPRGQGELFGLDRVEHLILENLGKDNLELNRVLISELEEFSPEFTDDVTIVTLEVPHAKP